MANNTNDLLFDLPGLSSSAVMSTLSPLFQLASDLLTYMLLSGTVCSVFAVSPLHQALYFQSGSNKAARCSIQGESGDISLTQAMLADLKFILHLRRMQLHVDMDNMQQMHHCTVARGYAAMHIAALYRLQGKPYFRIPSSNLL